METEYPWLVDARAEFECTRASICIISLFGSRSRKDCWKSCVGFYILFFFRPSTYATLPREKRERERQIKGAQYKCSTRRFCVSHGFHLFPKWICAFSFYLISPTHSFWLLVVFITGAPTWRAREIREPNGLALLCRNPFVPPINYRRLWYAAVVPSLSRRGRHSWKRNGRVAAVYSDSKKERD